MRHHVWSSPITILLLVGQSRTAASESAECASWCAVLEEHQGGACKRSACVTCDFCFGAAVNDAAMPAEMDEPAPSGNADDIAAVMPADFDEDTACASWCSVVEKMTPGSTCSRTNCVACDFCQAGGGKDEL